MYDSPRLRTNYIFGTILFYPVAAAIKEPFIICLSCWYFMYLLQKPTGIYKCYVLYVYISIHIYIINQSIQDTLEGNILVLHKICLARKKNCQSEIFSHDWYFINWLLKSWFHKNSLFISIHSQQENSELFLSKLQSLRIIQKDFNKLAREERKKR